VAETSGKHATASDAIKHLHNGAGAKYLVLAAPAKGGGFDGTFVYGVNDGKLVSTDKLISNASDTTNSVAPVVKSLKKFGLMAGSIVTTHAPTGSQTPLDTVRLDRPERGLAIPENIIDTSTRVAETLPILDPALEGKFTAKALRVPSLNASVNTIVFHLKEKITAEEILDELRIQQNTNLKGILKLSSIDVSGKMIGEKVTSVVVPKSVTVTNLPDGSSLVGMQVWYDNEAGFTNQYIRMLEEVALTSEEGTTLEDLESEGSEEPEVVDVNPDAKEIKPSLKLHELSEYDKPTNAKRKKPQPFAPVRLAINGGGRIATTVIRQLEGDSRFNLVAIAYHDVESLVDRLKWDTAHLKFDAEISHGEDQGVSYITINGKRIDVVWPWSRPFISGMT